MKYHWRKLEELTELKKKVVISPVTLEHIILAYVGQTNDKTDHPLVDIANRGSPRIAMQEAAADYILDKLNMEEG